MRIWDVHPGYLDRQRLLAEHRELHGVVAVTTRGLNGYAAHPETKRWTGLGWALHDAPSPARRGNGVPRLSRSHTGATAACTGVLARDFRRRTGPRRFGLLARKYAGERGGRIPLPKSAQELWAQHKYSVLARSQSAYRDLGVRVSALPGAEVDELAVELVGWLRRPPADGDLRNALQHMWGHLQGARTGFERRSSATALKRIQSAALDENNSYLLAQTALTELGAWLRGR